MGRTEAKYIFITFLLFVLSYVFTQIMIHLTNGIEEVLEFQLKSKLSVVLGDRCAKVKLIQYENAEFLDQLEKVKRGKDGSVSMTLCLISLVFYYIPYFILMSFWLFQQSPLLVVAIPLAFIPSIMTYMAQIKVFSKMEDESANLRRRQEACEDSIIGEKYIKETRMLGSTSYFLSMYRTIAGLIYKKEWKTYSSRQRTNIILRIIQSIGFIAIILLSLAFVAQGIISIGAFAAIFSSIDALFSTMNEAVLRQFGTISEELASVKNYLNFMSIDIENKEVKETGVCEKLSNVSFSYPNSEQKVLKDISLTIQEGGTLAIVGENGSGKTTLTKLIMGLYEPTEGTIIRDENRKGITSIFQNHFNYAMTLKQNIKISSKDDKNEN